MFKFYVLQSIFLVLLLLPCLSERLVVIEQNHLFDYCVLATVELVVLVERSWSVSGLLCDPLLLAWLEVSHELAVVLAYDSLCGVVEAIADVVGSFRDVLGAGDIVADQSLALGTQAVQLLGVETSVLDSAVVPLLVFELEVVVEKVFA